MAQKKSNKKKIIIISVIVVLIISIITILILNSNKTKFVSVQVDKVSRQTIVQLVTASGKIQPEIMVKINAEVSGEIISLPVKEGDVVKKEDLLVRVKTDQYQAQVDRAEASLQSAKANLSLQDATVERTNSEFKRAQDLFAKDLLSEQEFISAKTSQKISNSQYASAVAGVAQAKASLRDAEESLRKTSIYSPMNGVVSQLKSQLGERVSGSGFMQGTEIMTVSDLSRMEARIDVGENDVVLISVGDTTRIEVDAFPEKKLIGIVYEIANTAKTKGLGSQEEVTNFEVKVRILNNQLALRPGMSMTADIETETKQNVLAIPVQCVTTRQPKSKSEEKEFDKKEKPIEVVFLQNGNKAQMRKVVRGISNDNFIEIISGLKENDFVISGSFKAISRELEDSTEIKIEKEFKKDSK